MVALAIGPGALTGAPTSNAESTALVLGALAVMIAATVLVLAGHRRRTTG
jgi:hypothetical protein